MYILERYQSARGDQSLTRMRETGNQSRDSLVGGQGGGAQVVCAHGGGNGIPIGGGQASVVCPECQGCWSDTSSSTSNEDHLREVASPNMSADTSRGDPTWHPKGGHGGQQRPDRVTSVTADYNLINQKILVYRYIHDMLFEFKKIS